LADLSVPQKKKNRKRKKMFCAENRRERKKEALIDRLNLHTLVRAGRLKFLGKVRPPKLGT
jgi:hypothetical protein